MFESAVLSEAQQQVVADIREVFEAVGLGLQEQIQPGRELSIALTNLEQSAMWAIKAVSREEQGGK